MFWKSNHNGGQAGPLKKNNGNVACGTKHNKKYEPNCG